MSTPAPQVGIIGLGYVGLPLATAFAEAGVYVLGLDAIQSKVDQINSGRSYIEDVASERLEPLTSAGLIRATTNWDEIREVEAHWGTTFLLREGRLHKTRIAPKHSEALAS